MRKHGNDIRKMLLDGQKYTYICDKLQVAKSSVAYHARQLKLKRGNSFVKPTYDWFAIQQFYDEGHCNSEVASKFNIPMQTIRDAGKRGALQLIKGRICKNSSGGTTGGYRIPLSEYFIENSKVGMKSIKREIKKILPYYCSNELCILQGKENSLWATAPLVLHLDHINGIRNDNRLINLRWLCPNCHTQTETYCGRNMKNLVRDA